jgi:UDP-2,4-diacetamido-2,4,6-trideoxy-beta-L-altropyranose hydrolase
MGTYFKNRCTEIDVANPLIIRTDASTFMGIGHVMRCLALAQAFQDSGGRVVVAMAQSTLSILKRLDAEGIEVVRLSSIPGSMQDAIEFSCVALSRQASWAILDGYQFDSDYQLSLKEAGLKTLVVDDMGECEHYYSDLVLNQNAHADATMYRNCESYTTLLLGPRYAMLRREFNSWREWKRGIPAVAKNILVSMGGSDPNNVTLQVVRTLRSLNLAETKITIVVGGSNPNLDLLRQELKASETIELAHDPSNMPELMARADVAISAAGSTCWEMCLLGLPSILLDLAPNQLPLAQTLDQTGSSIHAGSSEKVGEKELARKLQSLLLSRELRDKMSRRTREWVDGKGAERVLAALQTCSLHIRHVEEKDCAILWQWANDPDVRAVSLNSDPIAWDRHVEWFNSKLRDHNAVLYLALNSESTPVGQVRYQIDGSRGVVSISLAREFRGKGYGSAVLIMATKELFRTSGVNKIDAYVKPDNSASLKLFARAGFIRERVELIGGHNAVHFILARGGRARTGTSWPQGSGKRARNHRRTIAISQPTYLPWLGYFDLIDQVDLFVLLDDVQFTKQSWQNRNRIKTPTGLQWLTVPVKYHGRFGQLIKDVEIRNVEFWRNQCRTLEVNYSRAPFFRRYFEELRSLFACFEGTLLVDLNIRCLKWFMRVLEIRTPVVTSSDLRQPGKRTELLANICSSVGASQYVSPLGSAVYLLQEGDVLLARDVEVVFQHYEHPQYQQLFAPFCPYASALDLIFNEGERAGEILRSGRRVPFSQGDLTGQLQAEVR